MDVLTIDHADGTRLQVSLRRSDPDPTDHSYVSPAQMTSDFAALGCIKRTGLLAPRPIFLDADGEIFGVAAMVMTFLPGRPVFKYAHPAAWTSAMAATLHQIHSVTPSTCDLASLRLRGRDWARNRIATLRTWAQTDALAARALDIADSRLDGISFLSPTLVHGDYWTGNTIGYRGKISGVVDWSGASVGERRVDVAGCRLDYVLAHGEPLADKFLGEYERLSEPMPEMWFFDLLQAIDPLLEYEHWIEGYQSAGMQINPADAEARLRMFATNAIEESLR